MEFLILKLILLVTVLYPTLSLQEVQPILLGELRLKGRNQELIKLDKQYGFCKSVNLLEITIIKLQAALASSALSSVDLIRCYTARIRAMDPYLKSVLELNPNADDIALKLDSQRGLGLVLSPLHGIPIFIKENIGTGDSLETSAGSLALLGIKAKEDAEIVKRLRKAGAIILGKVNLSEFASFRGTNVPEGWSSRGNKTHNAYVLGQTPEGSSSGSAVSVASNLIPVAIGTETSGSIVDPSALASCVGLKPTRGAVSVDGVIPLAMTQDTVGPIARTVTDAAIVFNVISQNGLTSGCFTLAEKNCKVNVNRADAII